MRNYYRILGIPENANGEEIRHAYRQLAKRHHPDRSGDTDDGPFKAATEAYEVLKDRDTRRAYDSELASKRRFRDTPLRSSSPWFDDEVAIDFPSLDAVVERIRQAFFGDDELVSPLSAEILLTAREAFYGVTVPLKVPVRGTCGACGGRGEVWLEVCGRCAGRGEALFPHQVRLSLPAGVRHGARFRFSITPPSAPSTHVEVRIAIQ